MARRSKRKLVGGWWRVLLWQSAQSGSRRGARVVNTRDMTLLHHALVTLTYLGSLPFETLEPPIY